MTYDPELVNTAIEEEAKCQSNIRRLISEGVHSVDDPIPWAAFHSNKKPPHDFEVTIGSLLPLFPDDSKFVAMIRHVMYVVQQAVHHLHPGQVPVSTLNQPLYAIAKQIQWNLPSGYGEDKFVILLGGRHLEMASLATIGDLLDGSGWTHALAQANIAAPRTAESFLKTTHVTRTKHSHQVIATALSILLHTAYVAYSCEESEPKSFDEWCVNRVEVSPQFQHRLIIMRLEQLILVYVGSLRDFKFSLYKSNVNILTKLASWFFVLDHTHYSKWVPIHIRDMMTLQEQHPDTAILFPQGGFVVLKTKRSFCLIAIDQAHELNKRVVKKLVWQSVCCKTQKLFCMGWWRDQNLRGLLESLRTIFAWMEVQGKLPGPISSTMSILGLHKSNLPLMLVLSFKYMYLKIWEIHSGKRVKTSWFLIAKTLLIQL